SGYTKEELLHASPLRLVHPEDRELIRRNIEKRLRGESLAHSYTFRGLRKDGQPLELEVFARRIEYEGRPAIHGMLVDITFLRETEQLRRDLLEVAEEILASHDVERILRRVVQAVVDHSPFQRAAIALYDLKHEPPLEGPLVKAVAVGLTAEEEERLYQSGGLTPEQRKQAFGATFQVSNSYYIPHDRVPWEPGLGVPGRVSLDGWHPEDFLFIPLRSGRGIIGHISVDDPRIPQAVNVDVLEPMEVFAGLAALAVERAARMEELKRHQEWLHGSYRIGQQLTRYRSLKGLLNGILEILKRELHYDYGAVMLQQGHQLAVEAVETTFADRRIDLGDRIPLEQGITGWVGRHRKPALVNDVTQDPRYVMGHQEI
ncbi:MAG: PAS domain S-box protein, partial [Thermoplasmata archaeon]|nr:PAS domain S-box protein [Thermoplasmata archaeon]NIY05691.1 PAS domain S-box protein [Thermoplasmata archaeon]